MVKIQSPCNPESASSSATVEPPISPAASDNVEDDIEEDFTENNGGKVLLRLFVNPCKVNSVKSLGDLVDNFRQDVELRTVMYQWHLNTIKSRACSLAVWAVDQGNRKVYEIERALTAENSWISRSIVWDGFSQHPLTGITDSRSFWANSESMELGEDRAQILCQQLQVKWF
jgi:hypothetical protein